MPILVYWYNQLVVVAEWLRRWTRNPLGCPRAGLNPVNYFLFYVRTYIHMKYVSTYVHTIFILCKCVYIY